MLLEQICAFGVFLDFPYHFYVSRSPERCPNWCGIVRTGAFCIHTFTLKTKSLKNCPLALHTSRVSLMHPLKVKLNCMIYLSMVSKCDTLNVLLRGNIQWRQTVNVVYRPFAGNDSTTNKLYDQFDDDK